MWTSNNTGILAYVFMAFLIVACGNNNDKTGKTHNEGVKINTNISIKKCDKIVDEYDDVVERSIEMAMKSIEGKEIDKAEEAKLREDSEELAKKIQALGVTGLGGAECWQAFVDAQMKWSNASMELQKKAIEKAQEAMQEYQKNN